MTALFSSRLDAIIRNSNYHYLLLITVVLLAGTLRFYKLGDWGFWLDEIYTIRDAFDLTGQEIVPYTSAVNPEGHKNQPISYALVRLALAIFGVNEWSARFVPAIVGIISIPLLYFLVRQMINPTVGLISVLLLAVSPWHLYWSQNARSYSILFLLCNLSLLTFYLGIEKDNVKYMLTSGVLLALGMLTHLTAIIILPALFLYPAVLKFIRFKFPAGFSPKNLLIFFLPFAFTALIYFRPIYRVILGTLGSQPAEAQVEQTGGDPLRFLLGVFFYIGIPLICLALGSLVYLVLIKRSRAVIFLGVSAITPLLAVAVLSIFVFTSNRYVFVILFSWIALGAYGIWELLSQVRGNLKVLVVALLMSLVLGALSEDFFYYRFQNGNRENWRSAFEYVKQHRTEEDLIVVTFPAAGDYYLNEKTSWIAMMKPEDIELSGKRVWFVENDAIDWDYPGIQAWVRENAREMANYDVHISSARSYKMRVLLYDPLNPR